MGERIGFELATDLEAIELWHHHIEQNDIALGALTERQRLDTIVRGRNVKIFGRQPRFEQLHVGWHVVDDENTGCHRGTFSPYRGSGGSSR